MIGLHIGREVYDLSSQLLLNLSIRNGLDKLYLIRHVLENRQYLAVPERKPQASRQDIPLDKVVFAVKDILLFTVFLDQQAGFAQIMTGKSREEMMRDL